MDALAQGRQANLRPLTDDRFTPREGALDEAQRETMAREAVDEIARENGDEVAASVELDLQAEQGVALEPEVPNYADGKKILESRLEQWRASNGLHDRRGTRAVQRELSQADETEQNDGTGTHSLGNSSAEQIQRESSDLISRAKENDFFLNSDDVHSILQNSETLKGGTEHDVHLVGGDENSTIVIRNTIEGKYGYFDGASPLQYLRRLDRNNKVFPATPIHVICASEGTGRKYCIKNHC